MAYGPLAYYLTRDILAEFDPTAFRTGDSRYDILRRLLIAVGGQCSCSADSEFALLRKILIALGGECRCGDSMFSLYQRILEQVRINSSLPNTPEFAFRAGDTLLDLLRKILNNLQNAITPPTPPVDLCCIPIGDYGFITDPVTETCDWGDLVTTPDCSDDWGSV